jgi:hypothetical protein
MSERPQVPDQPLDDATGAATEWEKNWAMIAHMGSFVAAWVALGFLAPLFVMLTKGKESEYVRRHAVESLNFQLNALIWIAVCVVLFVILSFDSCSDSPSHRATREKQRTGPRFTPAVWSSTARAIYRSNRTGRRDQRSDSVDR